MLSYVNISKEVQVDAENIKGFLTEYEYFGKIDGAKIKDSLRGGLLKKRSLANRIKDFIIDNVNKFTF